ncbi:MAG TPA: 4'-phosphopantetheinyl transferase superfamily protein [Tepidisphaeraceae bacterium]|nr:4'-phosphopantetheinyl transferase superfamily protein [Tepidisphaeraceae bacterium]
MDNSTILRQTVADLLKIDVSSVTADIPLNGKRLSGSIGRASLDAAIRRRLHIECPAAYTAGTFGELEAAITGGNGNSNGHPQQPGARVTAAAPPAAAENPAVEQAANAAVTCGVDVELVENVPATSDPWEEQFHRQWFTPAEIAYCSMQDDPRMHFAARWCAKEALKKCDPAFLHAPGTAIELLNDASGRPILRHLADGTARPLPHAVSVSHTQSMAVAMVVATRDDATLRIPAVLAQSAKQSAGGHGKSWVIWTVAVMALAASLLALARTFIKG